MRHAFPWGLGPFSTCMPSRHVITALHRKTAGIRESIIKSQAMPVTVDQARAGPQKRPRSAGTGCYVLLWQTLLLVV